MSRARAETATGGRKPTEATRAKLAARSRAAYERLTPEQRTAQLARIGRTPKGAGPSPTPRDDAPPGRPNPLAMTPRELWRALRGQ